MSYVVVVLDYQGHWSSIRCDTLIGAEGVKKVVLDGPLDRNAKNYTAKGAWIVCDEYEKKPSPVTLRDNQGRPYPR